MMNRIRWSTIFLLIGDWLALGLFVFLGQLDHGMIAADSLPHLLKTSAEIAVPWTAVALLLGAYKINSKINARTFLSRSLTAWLIAAPLALLLRAYLHGLAVIIVIFMTVTLGIGGAFLLGWRGLYFFVLKYTRRNNRPAF